MTLPKRYFDHQFTLPIPEVVYPNQDLSKWKNQRFTVGGRSCRLINLKTYRYFRQLPEGQIMLPKDDFISAIFTKVEQMQGCNVHQVGRHIVNSVAYQPVFQMRRKAQRGMYWRFNSPRDVEYGTALQIGTWLPDFLLKHVSGDYPTPDSFDDNTLQYELDELMKMDEATMYELFIDVEEGSINDVVMSADATNITVL